MPRTPREALRTPEERNALIADHYAFAETVLRDLRARHVFVRLLPREDAWQAACLGLIRAGDLYDEATGYVFCTYAAWWVRQHVCRAAARAARDHRRRLLALCDVWQGESGEVWQPPGREPTPYRVAAAREELDSALSVLPPRTALAVRLAGEGHSLAEIAWHFCCSHQRVQQLLLYARKRLILGPGRARDERHRHAKARKKKAARR